MNYENNEKFALSLDEQDPLRAFREKFFIPQHQGQDSIYFCGNSLGLQPKAAEQALATELDAWRKYGVEGHFHGKNPWMHYHKFLKEKAADIVGALPSEVVVMNNLTVNLHLMMVSFYRPDKKRFKIIMEGGAFPSDQYAMESQARFHGFKPEEAIVELVPRPGEECLRTEDILAVIEQNKNELAIVMMGGVNYYTGQLYDMEKITAAAHAAGAIAGFDLAHAAGNARVKLHDWDVDFAVWCSYKYLNSGPGGTSGVFVHERHADSPELPRFAGWWGHREDERFLMKKGFMPMPGADGWQLSNAQIFPMAIHKASLEVFAEAGMDRLQAKSLLLTGYLEYLVKLFGDAQDRLKIKIITPARPEERGCQLSLVVKKGEGKILFDKLSERGMIADWREPDVIRLAPVPLYNSFMDVFRFYRLLCELA